MNDAKMTDFKTGPGPSWNVENDVTDEELAMIRALEEEDRITQRINTLKAVQYEIDINSSDDRSLEERMKELQDKTRKRDEEIGTLTILLEQIKIDQQARQANQGVDQLSNGGVSALDKFGTRVSLIDIERDVDIRTRHVLDDIPNVPAQGAPSRSLQQSYSGTINNGGNDNNIGNDNNAEIEPVENYSPIRLRRQPAFSAQESVYGMGLLDPLPASQSTRSFQTSPHSSHSGARRSSIQPVERTIVKSFKSIPHVHGVDEDDIYPPGEIHFQRINNSLTVMGDIIVRNNPNRLDGRQPLRRPEKYFRLFILSLADLSDMETPMPPYYRRVETFYQIETKYHYKPFPVRLYQNRITINGGTSVNPPDYCFGMLNYDGRLSEYSICLYHTIEDAIEDREPYLLKDFVDPLSGDYRFMMLSFNFAVTLKPDPSTH